MECKTCKYRLVTERPPADLRIPYKASLFQLSSQASLMHSPPSKISDSIHQDNIQRFEDRTVNLLLFRAVQIFEK